MRRAETTWLAWGLGALSAGLAAVAVVLAGVNGEGPAELVANHHAIGIVTAIGMAVLGALIASRRPSNPIGWLMVAASVFLGVFSFTQQYAPLAARRSLPGLDLASWLATWTNLPGIAITITFVFLLFPDGRLPSPRWRPVAWATAVATVVPTVALAVRAWPARGPELAAENLDRPAVADIWQVGFLLVLALSVVALAAVVVRFRRSRGGGAPADQVVRLRGNDRDPAGAAGRGPVLGADPGAGPAAAHVRRAGPRHLPLPPL